MIRGIHFADFHLGIDTNGPLDPESRLNGRVADFLDTLDALADYAIAEDADIVILAGDAFHRHNPDPTYIGEFAERVSRIAEQCPFIIIPGNHDLPGNINKLSPVDLFGIMRIPNVVIGWDYEVHKVTTKSGVIQIGTVPYPLRSQFVSAKEISRLSPDSLYKTFKARVSNTIQNLSKAVDNSLPAILVGHFSVDTALFGSERPMIIGMDAEVSLKDLIDPVWDYVALGHIHYHQCLHESPPVIYSGSLERVDFTEEGYRKGFIWFEISNPSVRWEMVEVDARPYKTISLDLTGKGTPTERVLAKIAKMDLEGYVVRLKLTIQSNRENYLRMSEITDALRSKGVYYIHTININRVTEDYREIRLGDVPVASLSGVELLKAYFDDIGKSGKEVEKLLVVAQELMSDES